jgi:hypothetical protein
MAWCIFMNNPTRSPGRPVNNHISHNGRAGCNGRRRRCLAGQEQLSLVAWRRHRVHPDVLGDVKRLGIYPHRPPQPWSGPVQDLTKAGGQVQHPTDRVAHGLDQKSAIGVEQHFAVQGDKRPDVLWPALLLRPDQHETRSGHPLEPDRLAVGVRRIPSSLHTAGRHFLGRNEQTTIVTPTPSCRHRASRSIRRQTNRMPNGDRDLESQ